MGQSRQLPDEGALGKRCLPALLLPGVLVLVSGLALVGTQLLLNHSRPDDLTDQAGSDKPAGQSDGGSGPQTHSTGNWYMYRGGQKLQGLAEGRLRERLSLVWRYKTGGPVSSSAAIVSARTYIGSDDGKLYALDLSSGELIWTFQADDSIQASPLILDGKVFFGSADQNFYCLDASSGRELWKCSTNGQILGSANWTRDQAGRLTVLFGSYDNHLYCLSASHGKLIWEYQTESYINAAPAVGNGKVVFGGCDAKLHVLSDTDGAKIAEFDSGSYIAGSAALIGNMALVGNYGNGLFCVELEEAEAVWSYEAEGLAVFSTPAVGAGRLVFGARDARVRCLRSDSGKQLWAFHAQDNVDSSPVICDGKTIFGSDSGRIHLLDLSDGKELWSYQLGQPISSSPAVADGMVVFGCHDGYVYAFGGG